MYTVSNMDKVLNTIYLDAVSQNINEKTNAFFNKITKSSANIIGKEIVAPYSYGINGGVCCAAETATLPSSATPSLITFHLPILNMYGTMEISDKLLRISEGGVGSSVDMLNFQMENLLASAKFNLRRMLFQNGSGVLTTFVSPSEPATIINVKDTRNIVEGMILDFVVSGAVVASGRKVLYVDKTNKQLKIDSSLPETVTEGAQICVQGSYNCEIYGIPYIFDDDLELYGNTRLIAKFALPQKYTATDFDANDMQTAIDGLDEKCGQEPDMIISSYSGRRQYLSYLRGNRINIDYMNVDGGFKSLSYNGIPLFAEQFIDGNTMYFLNTNDFMLAQLGDWSWVEGINHNILHKIYDKAAYTATLVKYCNLVCRRPTAQASLVFGS